MTPLCSKRWSAPTTRFELFAGGSAIAYCAGTLSFLFRG